MTSPTLISAGSGPGITPNGLADNSIVRPNNLTALGSAPFSQGFAGKGNPYGLGVEPTVYLDELKRYQDHLNQLRRVNMGDDIADSSGYGLYLIRMPASIQPGECTRQGYGAVVTATMRHDFGADFLCTTYRNLVINDLVDQLAPVVFELIRSDAPKKQAMLDSWQDLARRYDEVKNVPNEQTRALQHQINSGGQLTFPKSLPSSLKLTRINEQSYPVPPTELDDVFLRQNLYVLAITARQSMQTVTPRATDVRSFLRNELETAYDLVSQIYNRDDPNSEAKIDHYERAVESIAGHVRNFDYLPLTDDYRELARGLPGVFQYTDFGPSALHPEHPPSIDPNYSLLQALTILSYAIAVGVRAAQRPAPGRHEASAGEGRRRLLDDRCRAILRLPSRPRGRGPLPGIRRRSGGRSSPSRSTRSSTSRTSPTPPASSATCSSPWPSHSRPGRSTSTSSPNSRGGSRSTPRRSP